MTGWRQVGIALAVLMVCSAAVRAQELPGLLEPGKLTFGTAATFPPFAYEDKGVLKGFDVEFGGQLARRLGLRAAYVKMEFDDLFEALDERTVDAVISAVYITEEREKTYDFVPYLRTGSQIVVAVDNPLAIGAPETLCGHRVAVIFETAEEGLANWIAGKCGDAAMEVTVHPARRDAALALRRGNADAIIDSTLGALTLVKNWPWLFEFAGGTIGKRRDMGIVLRTEDERLRAALEKAVAGLAADGTYRSLLKEFGLPPGVSPF